MIWFDTFVAGRLEQVDTRDAQLLEKVGSNLKAERARRNLTQEALARLSDLSPTQIARMERGENDSGISKYVRVALARGVKPADLFFDVESP